MFSESTSQCDLQKTPNLHVIGTHTHSLQGVNTLALIGFFRKNGDTMYLFILIMSKDMSLKIILPEERKTAITTQ